MRNARLRALTQDIQLCIKLHTESRNEESPTEGIDTI